jgi:hypothetical protein
MNEHVVASFRFVQALATALRGYPLRLVPVIQDKRRLKHLNVSVAPSGAQSRVTPAMIRKAAKSLAAEMQARGVRRVMAFPVNPRLEYTSSVVTDDLMGLSVGCWLAYDIQMGRMVHRFDVMVAR